MLVVLLIVVMSFYLRVVTCVKAKQTRPSFPDSSNKAKEVFDLIHCDL